MSFLSLPVEALLYLSSNLLEEDNYALTLTSKLLSAKVNTLSFYLHSRGGYYNSLTLEEVSEIFAMKLMCLEPVCSRYQIKDLCLSLSRFEGLSFLTLEDPSAANLEQIVTLKDALLSRTSIQRSILGEEGRELRSFEFNPPLELMIAACEIYLNSYERRVISVSGP